MLRRFAGGGPPGCRCMGDRRPARHPRPSKAPARANTHLDEASGAKATHPKLDLVLQLIREGDTSKLTRLERCPARCCIW
jgi:hypothetical protein